MVYQEKLKELINKKVSILLDHHKTEESKLKESYTGIVKFIENELLILEINNENFFIKEVWIDTKAIISVWVLKE